MEAYVIVATKGRAKECRELVRWLAVQTVTPAQTIFIGAEPADVEGLQAAVEAAGLACEIILSPRPGLTTQRNAGIDAMLRTKKAEGPWFAAFFDDDFRPAPDWLERVRNVFAADETVAGVTGQVLADGIMNEGLTEDFARAAIAEGRPRGPCWAQGETPRSVTSVYGCNMAFRDRVIASARFDERLPAYGWQEDRDYTGQALRLGRVIYHPAPKGVHLGVKGGRTSGVRMGYSQIANPIYLVQKGTMQAPMCRRFLWRAVAANIVKSLKTSSSVDYRGRLLGNLIAAKDFAAGRLAPEGINMLGAGAPQNARAYASLLPPQR